MHSENIVEKLGFRQRHGAVFLHVLVLYALPKLAIVFHEGQHELVEAIPDQVALELRVLHLLHFEDVGAFRVLKIFLYVLIIIYLERLQSTPELLLKLVRKRWQIFIVKNCS